MTRDELINAVKVKLEEFSPFEGISGSGLQVETNSAYAEDSIRPIHTYIDRTLDETADEVLLTVPLERIFSSQTVKDLGSVTIGSDLVGTLSVPDDYLRLYEFKMTSWSKKVTMPITPLGNPVAYQDQQNPFLRGKQIYPVLALNNRTFEVYSAASSSDTVETAKYVAHTAAENVQADLQQFIVVLCAAKVLEIFNRAQDAQVFRTEYASMITNRLNK